MIPHRLQSASRSLLFLLALTVPGTALAQPAFQVADINPSTPRSSPGIKTTPAILGTRVFFEADDGIHGAEPWVMDLTNGALSLVEDICPGYCSSFSWDFTVSGDIVFFIADDGVHGHELWKSDGTAEGTSMLLDLNPGRASSIRFSTYSPPSLLDAGGTLFFVADDKLHGEELWATDGTGIWMVADIAPGATTSSPQPWLALGDRLVFSASAPARNRDLWASDGTQAGTVILTGFAGAPFAEYITYGYDPVCFLPLSDGTFLFRAESVAHGTELWRSDGTPTGTVLVKDIVPGWGSSSPWGFTAFAGKIYFGTGDRQFWSELWATDGTEAGTVLVKTLPDSGGWSRTSWAAVAGERLVFQTGGQLWSSDGTAAGTFVLRDLNARHVVSLNAMALFLPEGYSADQHVELWRTDGTAAGTLRVHDFGLTPYCSLETSPAAFRGIAYFYTCPVETGQALWRSDGTEAGTILVQPPAQTSSFPRSENGKIGIFAPVGKDLVFSAAGVTPEYRLWRTDGTPGGTGPVSESVPPGTQRQSFIFRALLGDVLLFSPLFGESLWRTDGTAAGTGEVLAEGHSLWPTEWIHTSTVAFFGHRSDDVDGYDLWKTDGTVAGTVAVPGGGRYPVALGEVAGYTLLSSTGLFFDGHELWRTDGTWAGTGELKDIEQGWESSFPHSLASLGSFGLFVAFTTVSGEELWRTDATSGGTFLLKDIRPGAESSSPQWLIQVQNRVFFVADDGLHGMELWVSDGTEAGTRMVRDIRLGYRSSEIQGLARVRSQVFFVADDGIRGPELWASDGTAAGTRLVRNIVPGRNAFPITELAAAGHVLLFAASDGTHSVEPWVSDGTWEGTRMLQDIAPGPLPSSPARFTNSFPYVYFVANDGTTGFEPWALPRTALGSTFTDVPTSHPSWLEVETLAESGITTGCGVQRYCPDDAVLRAQMAVFLERAVHGDAFTPPPATGTIFTDVPADHWAASWIEQLAADGLTSGCSASPPRYCPEQQLTRAEMAVLLLRAKHGSAYTPPPATGTVFTDVPAGFWAAPWIERLAAEGITGGCAPGVYCPDNPVNRAEMAVFLTKTFNLPLP